MSNDLELLTLTAGDPLVPPGWRAAVAAITHQDVRRVMVIGAADVGKSTLCRVLLGAARASGRTAAFLDADVGQKTVGPPACVTASEESGSRLVFVGTTDPVRGWHRIVDGTRTLANAVKADLTIVNTNGLLGGPGRSLKADKMAALRPDLLIALGGGSDLERILGDHASVPVLRLAQSPAARHKTKAVRRVARQRAFRSYFGEAPVRAFGRELVPEALLGLVQAGVLVGLADAYGTDLGLGIVAESVSPTAFHVLTPVAPDGVHQVTPGSVYMGQGFSEMRWSET